MTTMGLHTILRSGFGLLDWPLKHGGQVVRIMKSVSRLGCGLTWPILCFAVSMSIPCTLSADDGVLPEVSPTPAPPFSLHDPQGGRHQLQDYRGRVVIVNFWASWCVPCRRELPSMNRAWAELSTKGITMLAINLGDEVTAVKDFLSDFPIDFPVLLDQQGRTSQEWQVRGLPTTFVLNPQGEIVYRVVGEREWDDVVLLRKVKALLPGT